MNRVGMTVVSLLVLGIAAISVPTASAEQAVADRVISANDDDPGEMTGYGAGTNCNENNGGCVPDGDDQTWCDSVGFTLNNAMQVARDHALDNMVSQTNVNRRHVGDFSGDCPSHTDTFWIVDDSLGSVRGRYECKSFGSSGNCTHAWIRLNPRMITNALNRNKTACHELGHSLGLEHHGAPYSDCMVNGAVSSGHQNYTSFHVARVNERRGDVGH